VNKNYIHLSAEERAVIMIEHHEGARGRAIARLLGRSASTVSRELTRNRETSMSRYDATQAHWPIECVVSAAFVGAS
jgi:IS30 family transposase